MCTVKKLAMLLLLLAAVVTEGSTSTVSPHSPADCDDLIKRLPVKDLHKVVGDWILVWAVSDHPTGWQNFPGINSCHVELQLINNKTIVYNETNLHNNKSCSNFVLNMSVNSDPSNSEYPLLSIEDGMETMDGVVLFFNETGAILDFYESCSDCLMITYKSPRDSQSLTIFKREGHHLDTLQVKADFIHYTSCAKCLGFPVDKPFIYDGVSEFCNKKSAAEVEQEEP